MNIIEVFDLTESRVPDCLSFCDEKETHTWKDTDIISDKIALKLVDADLKKSPVLLLFDREARCPISMLGVLKSGNYYVVLDCHQPVDRMKEIVTQLGSKAVITDNEHLETAKQLADIQIIWEEVSDSSSDSITDKESERLSVIRERIVDTDLAYVLFTSGSTGTPKGVAITHRNVVEYSKWFVDTFDLSEKDICGGQTPFYFSMSVSDIYGCIRSGASLQTIPKRLFSFPVELLEYMCDKRVNSIYWVPAAMSIIANWKALQYATPKLNRILFAGENMPCSKLNYWMDNYPDAVFANLFGPTETTDICVYYVVDRRFEDTDMLPIGRPCHNCGILILDEEGKEVSYGEEGELYAYGSFLSPGYYNDPAKTAERFVQNPLNKSLPEILYKTGDIVKYNDRGELLFTGRKDHQIKHLGYRIELGEIEAAASGAQGIGECAALYDEAKDKIILIFSGNTDESKIRGCIGDKLPDYMMPASYVKVPVMPHNANGKIDRKALKAEIN